MTSKRSLTAFALLTTLAVTPACGDLGSPRVEWMDYKADGSLVAFMATGIHVIGPSLDRETMTIGFDGLPATAAYDLRSYSLSADGRLAAVYFSAPQDSAGPSTIALFDLTTGAIAQTFHPDAPAAFSSAFEVKLSPQADLVYSHSVYELTVAGPVLFRSTVTDVGSGLPLWTTDRLLSVVAFSQDGTRLFALTANPGGSPARIEALDARTGATLYAVDVLGELDGLALTADGKLAGVIHHFDSSCTTFGACPAGYAFWSPADLTLLEERPGLSQTDDAAVRSPPAAFDCSRWSSLCALSIVDLSHFPLQPGSYFVSVVRTDGTPVQLLAVQGDAVSVSAFSPDGQLVATAPVDQGPIEVFRIEDGTRVAALGLHGDIP